MMSHFAELDQNNKVLRVLVGNPELSDADGLSEIINLLGGTWIQTSYNAKIRGKYATIDDSYDFEKDIFVSKQPFPSWIQDGSFWQAPIPKPIDDKNYQWDESKLNWIETPSTSTK